MAESPRPRSGAVRGRLVGVSRYGAAADACSRGRRQSTEPAECRLTTLIETIAGVPAASQLGQALNARAEILRLSEAAHDAVLLPREPGGLSHGLRAALAARMCRHLGDDALAAHYDSYVAHSGDLDV